MKRRIHHLAKTANIDPDVALQILQKAGYRFDNIHNQVSEASIAKVQKLLNQEDSGVKSTSVQHHRSEELDLRASLPQRGKTESIPRTTGGKSRSSVHHLGSEQVLGIHHALVEIFAKENDPISPPGPRDIGLLESAIHRPQTSLGNVEKYKTILAKASALFHSLILNHPFHNGNKRTALVSLVVFLDLNKLRIEASDDDLFDFVIGTANRHSQSGEELSSDDEVSRVEEWLRVHSVRTDDQAKGMAVQDFLAAIETAGGRYRLSNDGGTWVVWGPNGRSISIGRSNSELTGKVVRRYIQNLGLSLSLSGIHFSEFSDGLDPEQRLIRRFRIVLKRLAHT